VILLDAAGDTKEKSGKCEEDISPVGGKSEEATDLNEFLKGLQNLRCTKLKLLK
jgi:hypothetical protein